MTIEDFGTPIDEETSERDREIRQAYEEIKQLYEKIERGKKYYERGVLITKKENTFKVLYRGETTKIDENTHEFRMDIKDPKIYTVDLNNIQFKEVTPAIIRYTEPTRFFKFAKPKDNAKVFDNLEEIIQKNKSAQ